MNVRRIAISTAITALWLVMMGLLVRNHVLPRGGTSQAVEVSPDLLTEEWRDYEEWMKLTVARRSEGVSYTAIRRQLDRSGYLACNRIWLDLDVFGERHTFRLQMVASLDPSFQLERATADVHLDDSQMTFVALSDGARFLYRWQYEDQAKAGWQRLQQPISLLEAVRPLVARRLELKVGNIYRLPVLDSTWSLRQGIVEVRVEAFEHIGVGDKTVEAYRLATQLGPFISTTWVNPQGEVLRRDFGGNILMERVAPDVARKRFVGIDAPPEIPRIEAKDFAGSEGESTLPAEEIAPLNLLIELFRPPSEKR